MSAKDSLGITSLDLDLVTEEVAYLLDHLPPTPWANMTVSNMDLLD